MSKKDLLEGFTREQIAKAKECNNSQELLDLVKREGINLTKEQLEAINEGEDFNELFRSPDCCPNCGSKNVEYYWGGNFRCKDCGCVFPE